MHAVGKQAVQELVIPPCHEVRPRPPCARAHCRDLREVLCQSTAPSHAGEKGLAPHLSVTLSCREPEGRDSHQPESLQRDMLNICKGCEIRCNREREGWLSVDLLEGFAVLCPQGGRKRLLRTPCALGHACCVLASKQSQLAFFSSPLAVILGVKTREKKVCWLRSGRISCQSFLVKIGGNNCCGQYKNSIMLMDSRGQDYVAMHFMHCHVRTWHILLFIINQNSDSIKDERITLIHSPCYFGGQLMSDRKVLRGAW